MTPKTQPTQRDPKMRIRLFVGGSLHGRRIPIPKGETIVTLKPQRTAAQLRADDFKEMPKHGDYHRCYINKGPKRMAVVYALETLTMPEVLTLAGPLIA